MVEIVVKDMALMFQTWIPVNWERDSPLIITTTIMFTCYFGPSLPCLRVIRKGNALEARPFSPYLMEGKPMTHFKCVEIRFLAVQVVWESWTFSKASSIRKFDFWQGK